ncbi:MAG: hypothetical protein ACYDB0_00590 [Acidithiobacillus sp.]
MSGSQSVRQSNIHHLPVMGAKPTLAEMILQVLAKVSRPMDYLEVDAEAHRVFPDLTIGNGSIQAVLSSMSCNGTIIGTRNVGDTRTKYTLPPPPVIAPNLDVQASGEAKGAKEAKSPSMSISASSPWLEAVFALAQCRYGGVPNRQVMASLVRSVVLPAFLQEKPYAHPEFFWLKHLPQRDAPISLSLALTGDNLSIYDQVVRLTKDANLVKNGIAMNGARKSDGARLTMTVIGHTAVAWYLATHITDEECVNPSIMKFFAYLDANYLMDGRNAVGAYQSVQLSEFPLPAAEDGASPCAASPYADTSSVTCDVLDHMHDSGAGIVVDGSATKEGEPEKTGAVTPDESQMKPKVGVSESPYGLDMKSDGAGGLRISIRLPPEIVGRLMCSVADALDALTRSRDTE